MWGSLTWIVGAQIAVFVLVVVVLKRVLLSDTMKAVAKLKSTEAEIVRKEESIRRRMDAHEEEFQRRKAEADQELRRRREESEQEVAALRERIVADANAEKERILAEAHRSTERLKRELARDLDGQAVECAREAYEMVFSEKMTAAVNRVFVDELLDALEHMDTSGMTVDPADSEFTSSHPLDADLKERLRRVLADKFGRDVEIVELVDPKLIAGLKLRLGSLELDGSLLNRFREGFEQARKTRGV